MSEVWRLAIAGAAGAVVRYLFGVAVEAVFPVRFPLATLAVNVAGCFLLGLLTGLGAERALISPAWRLPIGTGFLGAFTTFSTWTVDSIRFFASGLEAVAVLNVVGSTIGGILAAMLGLRWGRTLFRGRELQ